MKRIIFILIILILSVSFTYSALIEIENEYVKIIGYPDTGGFIIKTTGGDPKLSSDQNVLLLYEDYPPTSFTTVYINGRGYKFGYDQDNISEPGNITSRMVKRGDMIITTWNALNIEVNQILKIVKNKETGNPDTVEIQYDVFNKDGKNNSVGIRIMLDTYLGKIDGVNFKTPQKDNITEEIVFAKDKLPDYWYCFDDLVNPSIKAQGNLKMPGIQIPDRIIFSSYDRFNKNLWDFPIQSDRVFKRTSGVFDSAVGIFWEPKELKPGEGLTAKTYYGIYNGSVSKGKIFNVTLDGPAETSGEPFQINANIQNVSTYEVSDVTAEMILSERLKFNFEERNIKNIGKLEKTNVKKTFWSLLTIGTQTGVLNFQVKVTGTVNNNKQTEIVDGKIEFKKKEMQKIKTAYTLYDFSWLNRIVNDINQVNTTNSSRLDEINKLIEQFIEKQSKLKYSKDEGKTDRNKITQRKKKVTGFETEIPDAVKSAVKNEEKESLIK